MPAAYSNRGQGQPPGKAKHTEQHETSDVWQWMRDAKEEDDDEAIAEQNAKACDGDDDDSGANANQHETSDVWQCLRDAKEEDDDDAIAEQHVGVPLAAWHCMLAAKECDDDAVAEQNARPQTHSNRGTSCCEDGGPMYGVRTKMRERRQTQSEPKQFTFDMLHKTEERLLAVGRCQFKGRIVRALCDIEANTALCGYFGEAISEAEYLHRQQNGAYEMDDERRGKLFEIKGGCGQRHFIDVSQAYDGLSLGPFINHACKHIANARPHIKDMAPWCLDQTRPATAPTSETQGRGQLNLPRKGIVFYATKRIAKGSEITWEYSVKTMLNEDVWLGCYCDKACIANQQAMAAGWTSEGHALHKCYMECVCDTDCTQARDHIQDGDFLGDFHRGLHSEQSAGTSDSIRALHRKKSAMAADSNRGQHRGVSGGCSSSSVHTFALLESLQDQSLIGVNTYKVLKHCFKQMCDRSGAFCKSIAEGIFSEKLVENLHVTNKKVTDWIQANTAWKAQTKVKYYAAVHAYFAGVLKLTESQLLPQNDFAKGLKRMEGPRQMIAALLCTLKMRKHIAMQMHGKAVNQHIALPTIGRVSKGKIVSRYSQIFEHWCLDEEERINRERITSKPVWDWSRKEFQFIRSHTALYLLCSTVQRGQVLSLLTVEMFRNAVELDREGGVAFDLPTNNSNRGLHPKRAHKFWLVPFSGGKTKRARYVCIESGVLRVIECLLYHSVLTGAAGSAASPLNDTYAVFKDANINRTMRRHLGSDRMDGLTMHKIRHAATSEAKCFTVSAKRANPFESDKCAPLSKMMDHTVAVSRAYYEDPLVEAQITLSQYVLLKEILVHGLQRKNTTDVWFATPVHESTPNYFSSS